MLFKYNVFWLHCQIALADNVFLHSVGLHLYDQIAQSDMDCRSAYTNNIETNLSQSASLSDELWYYSVNRVSYNYI